MIGTAVADSGRPEKNPMRFIPIFLSSFVMTATVFSMTLAGCSKEGETEPPMTPASAPSPAARSAGESIAATRCDAEQRCNRIGPSAKYGSRDHCMTVMRDDAAKQVNHCRLGIDQEDLRECLNEISDQDCSGPLDSIERSINCSVDDLCLD
jgi:hypothetical protein